MSTTTTTINAFRPATHIACRSCDPSKLVPYLMDTNETPIFRPYIPADKIDWQVPFPDYKPIYYTAPSVRSSPTWADPEKPDPNTRWNDFDGNIDRRSHLGKYSIVNGLPRNPIGRTGLIGRGLLGRWGPNHAADPIVTRWKKDDNGEVERDPATKKPILQFVAIQRGDTSEWAIPGGMCDAGEKLSTTMKREFMEEALNSNSLSPDQLEEYKIKLAKIFQNGIEIYRGYVDDPRNTDNAWMETVAFNFHDQEDEIFRGVELKAGDDAQKVKWLDVSSQLKLYASHKLFINEVANRYAASW